VKLDPSVPALIVRQDWNPVHHATLAVIRSLGRAGVSVHAILESPTVPAARSRHLAGLLPWWPDGMPGDERALRVASFAQGLGNRPVLFAMDDASAILLSEHAALLARHARLPDGSPGDRLRVADKAQLARLCGEHGIDHPRTRLPQDAREVLAAARELGLPLIAKWSRPWLLPSRRAAAAPLRSTTLVTTENQLLNIFDRRSEAGSALLLQELVAPGGDDRFFHGYFRAVADGPPESCFMATGRKELAWPRETGLTARGRWIPDPRVEAAGLAAARAAGVCGPLDLDFRLDPRTGACHLLDFNPRLGAQFRLFTDAAGLDLARAAHLALTGRTVPSARPRPGRVLTVEFYDPIGAVRPGRAIERAWLDRRDPIPFTAATGYTAMRAVRRLTERWKEGPMHDAVQPVADGSVPLVLNANRHRLLDVVVVGAGPYGLSVAAHARAAGLAVRVFGTPMEAWTRHMPAGMLLKSEPAASHLSDPAGTYGYDAYCLANQVPYAYGEPIPVETFAAYGRWFAERAAGEVEQRLVARVSAGSAGFRITLADGEIAHARSVVMATGAAQFAHSPAWLEKLPAGVAGHAARYPDLGSFAGSSVAVIGAGQSALETAALLAEHGARPRLLAAGPRIAWNDPPLARDRPIHQRLRSPRTALGPGLRNWALAHAPGAVRHLPQPRRTALVRATLGPAGAWWLKERFTDVVPVSLNAKIVDARVGGDARVRLSFTGSDGELCTVEFDHVIAATGYRVRLDRFETLEPELSRRLADRWITGVVAGPVLSGRFESAIPGLYFTGLPTAATFGPLMRFVAGTQYTAHSIAKALARARQPS
jgi:cation diffusion facilitator CzcD-associated flavoprotein CzcO/predicted ATP-grasp superfamily ATP-dependent carboligase